MEQIEIHLARTKLKLFFLLKTFLEYVKYLLTQIFVFFEKNVNISNPFILASLIKKILNWRRAKPKMIKRIAVSSKPSMEEMTSNNGTQYFSSRFFAVLHQISKHDPLSAKILALNHIHLADYEYHIDPCNCCDECKLANEERSARTERFKRAMMILRQRNPFKMSKSIDCIIR